MVYACSQNDSGINVWVTYDDEQVMRFGTLLTAPYLHTYFQTHQDFYEGVSVKRQFEYPP
jgi:hypothetical protein